MISDETFELIGAHLITGAQTYGDAEARQKHRTALAELHALRALHTGQQAGVQADQEIIEAAVRRHAVEMLRLSTHRPQPGEIFPAHDFAQAQWHQLRILALRTAPPDLAAAQLRNEALNALKPKLLITRERPS